MTEIKRKKNTRRKKNFIKKYSFELLILFLITSGVFLLVENLEIKSTILAYIKYILKYILSFLQNIFSSFSTFISTREGSDIIGMLFILTAFILIYFRYRKMAITDWNCGKNCPECESKMIRKKKDPIHKILARILFIKIRHYFCEKCNTSRLNFR
jgi:hypothetical protein